MLITFTWTPDAGTPDPDRVHLHVTGVHDHHDPELHRMVRAGDRWKTAVDVPADLVASYRIMPVTAETAAQLDAATDSRVRWRTVAGCTVPHVLDHPAWRPATAGEGFGTASGRLVMPDAPEQAGWDDGDTPEWTDEGETVSGGRRLWTAGLHGGDGTEAGAETRAAATPDHLLVLSDGRNWTGTALPAALHRLHAQGRLPRVGVVAVDTSRDRHDLLTRSAEYRTLIADTVVPWAWERAGVPADPRHTVIAGESLGGLSAVDLVLTRPDAVALAVSSSGSFWFPTWEAEQAGGEIAAEIRERAGAGTAADGAGTGAGTLPDGIRVHLSAGTGEGRPGAGRTTMADHSRAVYRALVDAGVPATCEITAHGHEMAGWTGALTRGLVELLS